jgi:hypothetical protein
MLQTNDRASNPASKENPSTIHHQISAAEKHSLQIPMKEDFDKISGKKNKKNRTEQNKSISENR